MSPVRNPKNKSLSNLKAIKRNRRVSNGVSYDIITFGSATLDIFLKTKDFSINPVKKFTTQKGVCFPFSSKVDVKGLSFCTGGGGTNTAAALAAQGLKVAFCGEIGQDFAGNETLKDLRKFGISTSLIFRTQKARTNLSVIFSWGRDRTCFVWRGASELLVEEKMPWNKLNAKWFYLAPLSGKAARLFRPLVNFTKERNIKVFANPGNSQIKLKIKQLKPILKKIDILLLNQEEASLLTGVSYKKEKQVFKKLDELVPGLVIMTKGQKGVVVSDGKYLWQAKAPKIKVIEKTGAGDAFGSGFLTGFINKEDIAFGLQLGMANASACIEKVGAKQGLLKKGQPWKKVRVTKKKLG